jgi:hypothetical protein
VTRALPIARRDTGADIDAAQQSAALLGTLRADPRSRAEFFALAGLPH